VIRVQNLANLGIESGYRERATGPRSTAFLLPASRERFSPFSSQPRRKTRDDQDAGHAAGFRLDSSRRSHGTRRNSTRPYRAAKPGRHSPSSCRIPASTANKRDSETGPACRALRGCAPVLEDPVLEDPVLESARNLSGALRAPIFARWSGIPPGNRAADYPLSPRHLPLPR
jgi:hypothetical protein